AAVEEVGYVRVLLGLCDAQVAHARAREHFAQRIAHVLGRKSQRQAEGAIVLGHADVADPRETRALEAAEVVERQRRGELARAVGAEVETYDLVAVVKRRAARDYARLDEFVGLVRGVGVLERRARVAFGNSLAQHNRAPGALRAFPSLVAVHRVVAPADR